MKLDMNVVKEWGIEAAVFGEVVRTCFDNANGDENLFVLYWTGCFPEVEFDMDKGLVDGAKAWRNGERVETVDDFASLYGLGDYDFMNPYMWLELKRRTDRFGKM